MLVITGLWELCMGSEHAVAFIALANPQYFSELFTIHVNHNALNEKGYLWVFSEAAKKWEPWILREGNCYKEGNQPEWRNKVEGRNRVRLCSLKALQKRKRGSFWDWLNLSIDSTGIQVWPSRAPQMLGSTICLPYISTVAWVRKWLVCVTDNLKWQWGLTTNFRSANYFLVQYSSCKVTWTSWQPFVK